MDIFGSIGKFLSRKPRTILFIAVIVLILTAWISSGLTMDSGLDSILPSDLESVVLLKAAEAEFGGQNSTYVIVKGSTPQNIEQYIAQLKSDLLAKQSVLNVVDRVDMESMNAYAPLYLPMSFFNSIDAQLKVKDSALSIFLEKPDIDSLFSLAIERLSKADVTQKTILLQDFGVLLDPKKPFDASAQRWKSFLLFLLSGETVDTEEIDSEYFKSTDGKSYFMIVKPKISLEKYTLHREVFFRDLDTSIQSVRQKSTDFASLEVGYTGGSFVLDYQADTVAFNNLFLTAIITLVAILCFLIFSFRSVLLPMLSTLPLLSGVLLTSVFIVFAYGSMNFFSVIFAALLFGLGIDFAIYIAIRYREERSTNADVTFCITHTLSHTGTGMLMGALTTSTAFALFAFAKLKAFSQMGIISAVGILFMFVAMLLVIPPILILLEKKGKAGVGKTSQEKGYPFLAKPLRFLLKNRITVSVLYAIIVVAAVISLNQLELDTDINILYPPNLPAQKWYTVLEKEFDVRAETLTLTANDESMLRDWVKKLEGVSSVKTVRSILSFVPEELQKKQEILAALVVIMKAENTTLESIFRDESSVLSNPLVQRITRVQIEGQFERLMKTAQGFEISSLTPAIEELRQVQTSWKTQDTNVLIPILFERLNAFEDEDLTAYDPAKPFQISVLPGEILNQYKGKNGKWLIEVEAKDDLWKGMALANLQAEVRSITKTSVSGIAVMMKDVILLAREDFIMVTTVAFISIFLVLLLIFRSFREAVLAMAPVASTVLFLLAFARWFGINFNIFNIMAFPILIGIGVDSGIHIVHRLNSEGFDALDTMITYTGKAVFLTMATTVIGFGSLLFSGYPGLSTLGLLVVIGMTLCFFLNVFLLPVLYSFSKPHQHNHAHK